MNTQSAAPRTADERLVAAFIQQLFTDGDLTAVDRYLHPSFVNHDPPFPGAPAGAEGMRQAAAMFRAAMPDWHSELDQMVSDGGGASWSSGSPPAARTRRVAGGARDRRDGRADRDQHLPGRR